MTQASAHAKTRNPGPSWGYRFLRTADKVLPECLFKPCRALGTLIAMAGMPEQRRHSRAYLSLVLGRPARLREVFRHFFAFEEALMTKLRIINGLVVPCHYGVGGEAFREWMEQGGPVFLGTLHVGVSDMLGFQIGSMHRRTIHIVRQRVGNSHDTERIEACFGEHVKFIWVNEAGELLYGLKEAAASPHAIAMQCDRLEHCARAEAFQFLGRRRLFPFTIYHLAQIFRRPVILSVGSRLPNGESLLHATPRFDPVEGEPREEALRRAREHFQAFLTMVEGLLHADPYLWFNFLPLNPPEDAGASPLEKQTEPAREGSRK